MRGKIKTARKEASKLHGAQATFVSLVDAGANETPFTLIKSKAGVKAMGIKKRKTTGAGKTAQKKSHKPLTSTKKGDEAETRTETLIAKMVFDGDTFGTEDEVREYLEKAEWDVEEIEITENADGDWEARSDGLTDDDFDKISKVETDEEGVEAFVGTREVEVTTKDDADDDDEDEDDDDDETVSKSDDDDEDDADDEDAADAADAVAETTLGKGSGKKKPYKKKAVLSKRQAFLAKRSAAKVTKFDAWDARFSKGNTLAKTLKDGMEWDGTPPGYAEVSVAFSAAVGNILADEGLGEGKQDSLNKTAAEYAEIIGGLDTFFDAYVEADEETVAKAFEDEGAREYIAKWADDFGDFVASGETPVADKVAKASGDAAAIDYSKVTETVQDIIAKALDPLSERIDGVADTVEAISTRAPTKKAAAPEDGGSAGPRKVKQKAGASKEDEATDRFAKSFLG